MKVLIVSPYLPYAEARHGTAVFMYGLLRHLCTRHEVTLLSFCDRTEEPHAASLRALPLTLHLVPRARGRQASRAGTAWLAVDRLIRYCRSVLFWRPYEVEKYREPGMRTMVSSLTATDRYDIVQFEFAFMAPYAAAVQHGRTLLHEHDVTYRPVYRRYHRSGIGLTKLLALFEWCRWARYEPAAGRSCDGILTVTEQDRQLMHVLTRKQEVYYLPRGVDAPAAIIPAARRTPHTILFVGTFNHQPNADAVQWMLEEILPRILERYPDTVTHIVGSNPSDAVRERARAVRGTTVHGDVDSVDDFLDSCSVFLAPLRFGGGVKVKIIHALARGIPVVTTKTGIEGIGIPGLPVALLGRSAEELAGQTGRIFGDSNLADRLGRNGHSLARELYSWQAVTDRLGTIYESLRNEGGPLQPGRNTTEKKFTH